MLRDKTDLVFDTLHFDDAKCTCPCFCDPTVPRQFEQTGGRYNDRSAFANNLQQDSVVQLQGMFQAQAQNSLEQTPETSAVNLQNMVAAISQVIAAAKA